MGEKVGYARAARWRPRTGSAAAVVAGLLTAVMLTSAAVISSLAHQSVLAGFGQGALFLAIGLIGLIVAWHQPRNPMGWVLFGVAFFYVVYWLARSYALLDYRVHDGGLPFGLVAVLLGQAWAPVMFLAGLSLLLFPDGRVPSARWKPMLWAYLALGASWLGGTFFVAARVIAGHHVSIDSSGTLAALDNPTGSNAWWAVTSAIFFVAVAVCWVAWLAGQVLTYVRSSGERRLQLKWLLSGATIFILAEIALFADDNPVGWWKVAEGVATVGTFALPVSIGFGIMKFRLYDIDRIISRTLAYALVTGTLVGVYAGLVLLATRVFTLNSPVVVAASTLVAAALFSPLRRRVQRAVDRKFNRARYDADQTVTAFAGRLQDAVDLAAVHSDLTGVVNTALEPTHVSVWVVEGTPR
jgi:hypothetical protein